MRRKMADKAKLYVTKNYISKKKMYTINVLTEIRFFIIPTELQ